MTVLKTLVCLAAMMHGEAVGEGDVGMLAVAKVAIHRDAADPCRAIQEPGQFQGYNPTYRPTKHELELAERALKGDGPDVSDAYYFVRIGTRVHWLTQYVIVAIIGHHEFLAKKG